MCLNSVWVLVRCFEKVSVCVRPLLVPSIDGDVLGNRAWTRFVVLARAEIVLVQLLMSLSSELRPRRLTVLIGLFLFVMCVRTV